MSQVNMKVGELIPSGTTLAKDAIHVAIAPAVADVQLKPGQPVVVVEGRAYVAATVGSAVGVVDPFLRDKVKAGESFWVFLYPGKAENLRHEWDHPAFVPPTPVADEDDYDDSCSGC